MSQRSIVEGETVLKVRGTGNPKGPAPKASVFYNSAMRCNRDITVLFAMARAESGWTFLDALSGTGAKGLRVAVESGVDMEFHLNDMNPQAFSAIRENIRANRLGNVTATNLEFNALLSGGGYDWIDIDPYGSPVNFTDLAVRRLSRGGILSVTATDTAALCGTRPDTCRRRYMATPLSTGCRHEFGLRILVGCIVRRAAVFDMGLELLLAYYQGHYFRAFFQKRKGARWANSALDDIGHVAWSPGTGYRVTGPAPDAGGGIAGPLWTGDLWVPDLIKDMLDASRNANVDPETPKLLGAISSELLQPPYHYHMDEMARSTGSRPLKTDALVDELRASGFRASGVHYSRKGFRTDAPFGEIAARFRRPPFPEGPAAHAGPP